MEIEDYVQVGENYKPTIIGIHGGHNSYFKKL